MNNSPLAAHVASHRPSEERQYTLRSVATERIFPIFVDVERISVFVPDQQLRVFELRFNELGSGTCNLDFG